MSFPNGGQPGQPGQPQEWGQPQGGQPQQWGQPQAGQPQHGGQQTWGQAASTGFNKVKTGSGFNPSAVRPGQWIALGLWVLTIIALSIPFVSVGGETIDTGYGTSYTSPDYSVSGWNGGLLVMFFICALLAAVAAAIELFVPTLRLPFPMAFVTGGLLGLAGLFGIIEFLTDISSLKYYSAGGWIMLILSLVALAGAVLEIMTALKAPKAAGTAGAAQWGQPAAGQWGAPQTGGHPAQPQGQWGAPQSGGQPLPPHTGGQPVPPQTGGQPAQPQQQWGQNPPQGQPGQWGNPQG
ncbi:single stranded DNA-binding domain-containing protein [Cumulibacter manganitolerans]|uniref:hypothetical protein n=1 Tax=Cumulibacter manganitolerans TaxID=1884992 RepID=UPI00129672FA|nr:hypothetical protein [Cumulibacter manganitolerans]